MLMPLWCLSGGGGAGDGLPDQGAEGVVGGDVAGGDGDGFGGKCFESGGVEGEVGPDALGRGKWYWVAIGAVGDGRARLPDDTSSPVNCSLREKRCMI